MKEIGGYFELECWKSPIYYPEGIYLNLCRNGFRYLIRALGIKKIHVPIYTCHVVNNSIKKEGCEVVPYSLDVNMMPTSQFEAEDYIIYNNYFGVIGNKVSEMTARYNNLIVDNAQAFYSNPKCRAAVYSPRKFFGLPDSGILVGCDIPRLNIKQGHSFDVTSHLLKRHDYGAQAAYHDFCINDEALEQYSLETISPLTKALMGNIDYEYAKQKRLENFKHIQKHLPTLFPISMAADDVPLVYPLWIENGDEIRSKLIHNKIFCARYWPNVIEDAAPDSLEYNLTKNLIAIPIDQRYNIEDMDRVLEVICKFQ